jgi:hypothetical protein
VLADAERFAELAELLCTPAYIEAKFDGGPSFAADLLTGDSRGSRQHSCMGSLLCAMPGRAGGTASHTVIRHDWHTCHQR